MSFRILYVAATEAEAGMPELGKDQDSAFGSLDEKTFRIESLITGVGAISTIWNMKQWLANNPAPDLVINGGIAGAYSASIRIGDVVMPVSDCFADSGIEDRERVMTLFEAGLADPDKYPYNSGVIGADMNYIGRFSKLFSPVRAITVNMATGSQATIQRLVAKFDPDIETMEGAAFFYVCRMEKIPFLAIRAISNKVEPRNRDNWKTGLALNNLGEAVRQILEKLKS